MNNQKILERVYKVLEYYNTGQIKQEHKHEVNPGLDLGSRENYLYFTLPVALNFQRSSPALRQSALLTWQDKETRYLFYPEEVVSHEWDKIQADLTKHKLALQKNKHVYIWIRLCQTFYDKRSNDPRNLISDKISCVTRIRNELVNNKKDYPYLCGSKISDYRIFIIDKYTDILLKNKHKLSIIPDTHIMQSSVKLGLTSDQDSPKQVKQKRFGLLQKTNLLPVDLHSILWNWSRGGFYISLQDQELFC